MGFSFKLINDEAFCDLKYTLDNTMKMRVASGIGISAKQAEVLSVVDEDYLWLLGYLGTSRPDQLLNTVVFCVGKGFALQVGKEHWALCGIPFNSQFKFLRDSENEIYRLGLVNSNMVNSKFLLIQTFKFKIFETFLSFQC